MTKLISIILPIYNEEKNIKTIVQELNKYLFPLRSKYKFEFIFVNDGSTDQSLKVITDISKTISGIKYFDFSRNFGKEVALTCGLHHAQGKAVIMLDSDLQHPPRLLPEFIKKWENGAEIVIGINQTHKNLPWFRKLCTTVYYTIYNLISAPKIIPHATDFRLLDQKVVQAFNLFSERNRLTRGLIDWLGFHKDFICFETNKRRTGSGKYSFLKLIKLATRSFVSHSLLPLKTAGYLGILITCFSTILGLYIFIDRYLFQHNYFSGIAIVVVFNLFLIGIVLGCLGLIALYIGSIHQEVIARPLYVIRKKQD
jgi:dolichol-phosphate mannosyltransferase